MLLLKSIHDVSAFGLELHGRSSAQFPDQSINNAHLIVLGHLRINRKQN
jgi:hypothetical protein